MDFISGNLFTIIIIIIVAAAVIGFSFFSKKAVVKRRLRKAKLKSVEGFKNGQTARIIGRVECTGDVLVAPLSGRKCAYYYVLVEKKTSSGKNSHWSTLIEDEAETGFVLKDGSKYAYVDDEKLRSYIVQDREYSSGFMEDATEILEAYLNKHGHNSENYFGFNKTIRYHEAVLELDEAVAVLGTGHWKQAYTVGLPERYEDVLVMYAGEGRKMYMSDDPDTLKVT